MATMHGNTVVNLDDSFFEGVLRSAPVDGLCKRKAETVLAEAKATAPVGDPQAEHWYGNKMKHPESPGAYKASLHIEAVEHAHRRTYMVVADSDHAMIVEMKRGILARALKKAGK